MNQKCSFSTWAHNLKGIKWRGIKQYDTTMNYNKKKN